MIDMLALGMPGIWEWAIILVIAVLIFGRRLPGIARALGKSVAEFKKGLRDTEDGLHLENGESAEDAPGQPKKDTARQDGD
jgi:sec-independent protein translocase protein TatA